MTRRPRAWRTAACLLCGVALLALGPAAAQQPAPAAPAAAGAPAAAEAPAGPPAAVRVGEHKDFTRIVIDLSRPTPYSLSRNGASTTLTFQGVPGLDLATVRAKRWRRVDVVDQAQAGPIAALALSVPANAEVRHFKNGNAVVVDIFDPAGGPAKPAPAPDAAKTDAPKSEPPDAEPARAEAKAEPPRPPEVRSRVEQMPRTAPGSLPSPAQPAAPPVLSQADGFRSPPAATPDDFRSYPQLARPAPPGPAAPAQRTPARTVPATAGKPEAPAAKPGPAPAAKGKPAGEDPALTEGKPLYELQRLVEERTKQAQAARAGAVPAAPLPQPGVPQAAIAPAAPPAGAGKAPAQATVPTPEAKPEAAAPPKADLPKAEQKPPAAPLPKPEPPAATRPEVAKAEPPKAEPAKPEAPKPPEPSRLPEAPPEAPKADAAAPSAKSAPAKPEPAKPADPARAEPPRTEVAKLEPPKPEAPRPEAPKPAAPTTAAPPAATVPSAAPAPAGQEAALPQAITVTLDPGGPSAVAVFERAGFIYVVFDRELPSTLTKSVTGATDLMGEIESVPAPGVSAFRLAPPVLLQPRVEREGTAWRILLDRGVKEAEGIAIDSQPDFPLGPRLVAKATDAGKVVEFADPVVGDTLRVIPLPVAGQLVPAPHRYAEAHFLATVQGLAVRPIDDRLMVQPSKEGVEISVPGGLRLSPPTDTKSAEPPPAPVESAKLFDYQRWGRVPPDQFLRMRQKLQAEAAEAPAEERDRARLNLARFFVANGLGPEAKGLLDLMLQNQPDLANRAEFKAVRGVALALSDDPQEALDDLGSRELAGDPDAQLWRASVQADLGEHGAALDGFAGQADLLRSYPDPFFARFIERAAAAALHEKEPETASRLLDRYVKRRGSAPVPAALQYLRGEAMLALGDAARAKELWTPLLSSHDRLYRTRAQFGLINLRLAAKEIDARKAAEEMERLRFAWRGDELELDILRRLGQVHAEAGNYPQAFDTMKRTISLFPDSPAAKEIAKEMTDTFANLYLKDGAAHLSPVEALSLYEQYRELTPVGADGDAVIRRLAERLVEIDLLDRASDLLERQVDFRLAGVEKAQVGTRLAGIRLLNSQPDQALSALDRSEVQGLPADLAEERRLLRARALSRSGKNSEAIDLLSQDQSPPANMLRIDIAWRDKQWGAAASALASVIGDPPAAGAALEPGRSRLVVNRAVALSLAGDSAGLEKLRADFGPAMAATPEANTFKVLTRPQEAAGLVDAATIKSRVAEIDMFSSFLANYRKKAEAAPPAATPAPADAAAAPAAAN